MIVTIDEIEEIDESIAFVVVWEAERYQAQLIFHSNSGDLISDYPQFLSSYSILVETGLWGEFVQQLEADGFVIYVLPTASAVLAKHEEWSQPLVVEGLIVPSIGDKPGELFHYQQYAVRKGLDGHRFLFANHGTGTGKSLTACAISQELFNRGEIDVVLFFTLRKMKINITRAFNNFTELDARNIEGEKAKRRKEFAKNDAQVYVLNYEKANFDFDILSERIKGKRVLFVFDEVQKILVHTAGKPNKAGAGMKKLVKLAHKDSHVWPMSATVINADPQRFFYLFEYVPNKANPLKNITTYRKQYARTEWEHTPWGMKTKYIWDLRKLEEIRHIVAPFTHAVRKSDPGIRELFKNTAFEPIYIQLSDEDRELYDFILETAGEDEDEDSWGNYYRVLRYLCNTAEALKHSKSEIAQAIVEALPDLSSRTSAKMETLMELITSIRDQGDKCVVFTQYTNLGLFLIADELDRVGITHVVHYGTGMTDQEAQAAQDDFKADSSITVFLSSDAGSHGLSFQEARYVINYDLPYSFDLLTQRNDRIDRADSYLEGLTSYVFITEDTVEERIWSIINQRRLQSAAIQGTKENFDRPAIEQEVMQLSFGGMR